MRHCRWVDEVVPDAPWVIDAEFIEKVRPITLSSPLACAPVLPDARGRRAAARARSSSVEDIR